MKIYTIIGGVNGCGRSSLTGVLKEVVTNLGNIIDVDKIVAQNNGDKLLGGKKAIATINTYLNRGYNFTQETTLSGQRPEKIIRLAK